ncbi:uncharacterized protein LOC127012155 [Drosophila biarmipes]|uniref:uncharacterized protein LOC127012155 n=1 Tax=Drosophila biarmipes TaxID=125945 RepID=UPI0021CCFEDB|nr:uncharacterized protein LOC127012155 [Drosophila biarmipes]
MYRCVRVTHPHQFLQCTLWRERPEDEVQVYSLDTVTYGTKPAGFSTIRAMQQLFYDEEGKFPVAAKIIRTNFYVDDPIAGGDTIEKGVEIRQQIKALLERGHFPIRKWCSNEPAALGVDDSDREKTLKFHEETDVTKALGLSWDTLWTEWTEKSATKRNILSAFARFFDPLRLIAPIITKLKIFMQVLWKDKLDWDESLLQSLHSAWLEHMSQIATVACLKLPRFVLQHRLFYSSSDEIHGFCDASMAAYGACIYFRSENQGIVSSNLLCSKSRVAPLQTLTIPKLELSAALLLSELASKVAQIASRSCTFHCWSDSTMVLAWIHQPPSDFNIFVSNRISQIEERTNDLEARTVKAESGGYLISWMYPY